MTTMTIATAAETRTGDRDFFELPENREFELDVIEPRSGYILDTIMVFADAALYVDGQVAEGQYQVHGNQHGDRFDGVLYIDDDTLLTLRSH